jgi:hypothetical protein
MLNGNLSNTAGITIAFRCEDCLIHYRESNFKDKVLNSILGKAKRAEVDPSVLKAMEYIYRQTEYTVDIVVENKNYSTELESILSDLPFNRVILIDKDVQVSHRLMTGDITYYVDTKESRRSLVNNKYALSLEELNQQIRRRQ